MCIECGVEEQQHLLEDSPLQGVPEWTRNHVRLECPPFGCSNPLRSLHDWRDARTQVHQGSRGSRNDSQPHILDVNTLKDYGNIVEKMRGWGGRAWYNVGWGNNLYAAIIGLKLNLQVWLGWTPVTIVICNIMGGTVSPLLQSTMNSIFCYLINKLT